MIYRNLKFDRLPPPTIDKRRSRVVLDSSPAPAVAYTYAPLSLFAGSVKAPSKQTIAARSNKQQAQKPVMYRAFLFLLQLILWIDYPTKKQKLNLSELYVLSYKNHRANLFKRKYW